MFSKRTKNTPLTLLSLFYFYVNLSAQIKRLKFYVIPSGFQETTHAEVIKMRIFFSHTKTNCFWMEDPCKISNEAIIFHLIF